MLDMCNTLKEAVSYINNSDAFVLAVDIPSGIHADSGEVMGAAVFADVGVAFIAILNAMRAMRTE